MPNALLTGRFLAITAVNFCLFLIVTAWNFLPVFVVGTGGSEADAGVLMGSMGITSLGSLPLLAPLIDRYGRNPFIRTGILGVGLGNCGFLLFPEYSPLMILIRLFQGLAFAACFTACATAVVDSLPPHRRAQGIGLFGISGSLAMAVGPYVAEMFILRWGFNSYFALLVCFGIVGILPALLVAESRTPLSRRRQVQGFFSMAIHEGHVSMMLMAAVFGAGFSALLTFFPLHAKQVGITSGPFFVSYGVALIGVRIFLGRLADNLNRDGVIFACLLGFAITLAAAAGVSLPRETLLMGILFGAAQALSYPAMMASMVDRSRDDNRAVVVSLFTGSFGIGIHLSSFLWGAIANLRGLSFMFSSAGVMILCAALISAATYFIRRSRERS
ncbi:MAG: MFS transporter [Pseudomonadota bacterium]